jgi:hypothetical protein
MHTFRAQITPIQIPNNGLKTLDAFIRVISSQQDRLRPKWQTTERLTFFLFFIGVALYGVAILRTWALRKAALGDQQ